MPLKLAVINGPNLNMLGKREPGIYGDLTLDSLNKMLDEKTRGKAEILFFQSNHEGEIIEYIQGLPEQSVDSFIINAGAFTHTSVAIRDAILSVSIPFIEVHISNIYKREDFRHKSWLSDIALGQISGLGAHSYLLAIEYFLESRR